jgi:hypothetical protein
LAQIAGERVGPTQGGQLPLDLRRKKQERWRLRGILVDFDGMGLYILLKSDANMAAFKHKAI